MLSDLLPRRLRNFDNCHHDIILHQQTLVLTITSDMYSHLRQGAFGSIVNLSARRFDHRGSVKFSPFKVASARRNFQSFALRQGQAGLAESPRYDEQNLEYESAEELPSSQPSDPQAPGTSSSSHHSAFTSTSDVASQASKSASCEINTQEMTVPLYYRDSKFHKEPYWQKIGRWKDVTQEQFLSHRWNVSPTQRSLCSNPITKNVPRLPRIFKVPPASSSF